MPWQVEWGLAAIKSYVNPNDPGEPASEQGTNPETTQMYQKGAAFQQWINDKLPENQKLNDANPIKMGIAGGIGSLIPLLATGGVGMAASGAGSAYEESKQAGATPEKASAQATKMGAVWGVLGVADVGMFLKPIQRSAPGVIPWITAKAAQAVRSGLTFAGTNELGDWLSSEIGQASDIPLQYKPTVQRIVVNALTGAMAGAVAPTSLKAKESAKPAEGVQEGSTEQAPPSEPPGGSASAAKFTPSYHFDTDSYGIKNDKGEFVKTGYGSEEEAAHAASEMAKPVAEEKQPIAPEVVERYKQTISDEAQKQGFALTPEQLDQAARVMAESHAKPVEKSQTTTEIKQPEKPSETPNLQEKPQTPVEVAPRALPPTVLPKLPRELAGAKSGFRTKAGENTVPQFSSDVDKALYIVREKSSGKSASHDKYVDFLKNKVGMTDAEIQKGSEDVLAAVKNNAEGKKGKVSIPHVYAADKDTETTVPQKRTVTPFKNPNVIQLAAELGGIKDEGGELKSMDAHKVFVPGRGRLVRDTGVSLDRLGEALQDRGYVKERPTKSEVIELLREGINGNHTHAEEDRGAIEERDVKANKSAYHEDLERHAGEMGIDTTGMKPEEIHAELEKQLREAADEHNFLDEIDDEDRKSVV